MSDADFLRFAIAEKQRQFAVSGDRRLQIEIEELYRRLLECEQ